MPNRFLLAGLKGVFRTVTFFDRPTPPWDASSIRSILLINTTALGDTLFSTPAIRAIRLAFPEARLISLASRTAKEVLLHNPNLDRIIDYPGRVNFFFFFRLPKLLKTIREEQCDMAVILHGNDPDAVSLAYLAGARYRLGWRGSRLAFLLTHPLRFDIPKRHYIEIWRDHLSALGIKPRGTRMELTLSAEEMKGAENYLMKNRLSRDRLIGLHPFANRLREKRWPLDRVVELGTLLAAEGFSPILFGGIKEKEMADAMVVKSNGRMISAAGQLALRQTMALIKRCALFITLDSGPLHIAQALGVPVVALFGPSDPRVSGPLEGPAIVLKKEYDCSPCGRSPCPYQIACMESIQIADILKAVRSLMRPLQAISGGIGDPAGETSVGESL